MKQAHLVFDVSKAALSWLYILNVIPKSKVYKTV